MKNPFSAMNKRLDNDINVESIPSNEDELKTEDETINRKKPNTAIGILNKD